MLVIKSLSISTFASRERKRIADTLTRGRAAEINSILWIFGIINDSGCLMQCLFGITYYIHLAQEFHFLFQGQFQGPFFIGEKCVMGR